MFLQTTRRELNSDPITSCKKAMEFVENFATVLLRISEETECHNPPTKHSGALALESWLIYPIASESKKSTTKLHLCTIPRI